MSGREDMLNVVGKNLVQEENGGQRKRGEGGPCPKKLSITQLKFLVAPLVVCETQWSGRTEAVSSVVCVRRTVDRGEQNVVYVRDDRMKQRSECGFRSSWDAESRRIGW